MQDLYLDLGGDLNFTAGGDLQMADDPTLTNQRLGRRFFTSPQEPDGQGGTLPADYIFDTTFGAGLGRLIDGTYDSQTIAAIQRSVVGQARLEPGVAQSPQPSVSVTPDPGNSGVLDIQMTYTTAQGNPAQVGFVASP